MRAETRPASWTDALRGGLRLGGLGLVLVAAWFHGKLVRLRTPAERSRWRMLWCRRSLRALGMQIDVTGTPPASGVVVCNHLSYLDCLTLGALLPAVFVSKSEVRRWPLVGPLCTTGGTLYLQRESPRAVIAMQRAMRAVLSQGVPIVLFPEGTTTCGDRLLPFHPALLQPAVHPGVMTAAAVAYATNEGNVDAVAAYYGDDTLMPHLAQVCRLRGLRAYVAFGEAVSSADRREAAARGQAAVAELRGRVLQKSTRSAAYARREELPATA